MAFTSGAVSGSNATKPKTVYDLQKKKTQELTFGDTLKKVVSKPTTALNLNQTIPKVDNVANTTTDLGFNTPGVTKNVSPFKDPGINSTGTKTPVSSKPVSIPDKFTTGQSSAFSAPQGVTSNNVTGGGITSAPGRLSDGRWDPNYTPSTEAEAFSSGVDAYTRQKWLENFYKSQGTDLKANSPASFEDEAKEFLGEQEQQKSLLDFQIYQATSKAQTQADSQDAYNKTSLTPGREGVVSQSNIAARDAISNQIQGQVRGLEMDLNQKKTDLGKLQQAQSREFLSGREDQIRSQLVAVAEAEAALQETQNEAQAQADKQREFSMDMLSLLSDNGALANLSPEDMSFLESGMEGIPPGIVQALGISATRSSLSEQEQQQFDNQVSGLNSMLDLAQGGVVMSNDMMMSFAKQTKLPLEDVMGFNQLAETVMADKSMDPLIKEQTLQKGYYELQRQMRGAVTADSQNLEYLAQMQRDGVSPDIINAFASKTGLDTRMQAADLKYKQAQANIEYKKSNGIPITAEDMLKQATAYEELAWMNGGISGTDAVYVPNKSLTGLQVTVEGGEWDVVCPPDLEYQCGAFVNRVWGLAAGSEGGFGSSGQEKQNVIDQRGIKVKGTSSETLFQTVKPGMAFYMPIANNEWDHVGLVKSITPDGIWTKEANADGTATTQNVGAGKSNVTTRFLPWSQVYGFVEPPAGAYTTVGNSSAGENALQKYTQQALDMGKKPADARKWADEQVNKDLAKTSGYESPEKQATIKNLFGQYDEISKEVRVLDQGNSFIKDYNINTATGADDIALIYAFNKVMDPRSVVREGEFQIASSVGGFLDLLGANVEKVKSGSRLTPIQRLQIVNTMENAYTAKRGEYDPLLKNAVESGKKQGIDDASLYLDYMPEDWKDSEEETNTGVGGFFNNINRMLNQQKTIPDPLEIGMGGDPLGVLN